MNSVLRENVRKAQLTMMVGEAGNGPKLIINSQPALTCVNNFPWRPSLLFVRVVSQNYFSGLF
jgi:hypothetical protein